MFALLLELLGIGYNLNISYLLKIKFNKNNVYNFGSSQQNVIHLIGMTDAVWLLFIGRGLIQYKDWSRKQLNYYVVFSQFNALLLFVYALKTSPIDGTSNILSMVVLIFSVSFFIDPLVNLALALFVSQPYSKGSLH